MDPTLGCQTWAALRILRLWRKPHQPHEWGFICCYRDKAAPQLWMQPGWHLLLDVFLQHCWKVFQHSHLGAVESLETALQQQMRSQVGAS